ncbi:MAG: hypothetical protein EOR68_20245 [Mesorhizobium sp.]|uniref:hypothetical protein n=1 Tax=Mesorhizobium sp. TaxID=1871066 RepID=UPI000FE8D479|nr:hypothetical protein [Mesorhizobium sp.]RWL95568.1 MAG: hypothetical protein EOR68_20245 [Mesorhizobium sp.]TIP47264.1 MAG: hypothetical protein E5X77_15315 [Mesorhizobium sp.]
MKRAQIEEQNRYLLRRQREFRQAADVVTQSWMAFPEIEAIAVIGSVAKPLRKEVPRFSEFRRARIEVWHECGDLDLAVWVDSQHRLGELRRTGATVLRQAFEAGLGISVANHQLDVFLFEPGTDHYLGRLCSFNQCPKRKEDCLVPGCGATPFNKRIADFRPYADLLEPVTYSTLYRRDRGILRSALELPNVDEAR